MGKGWDDVSFDIAKTMYKDGNSNGIISRALKAKGYDLSRNAVIGKLNRSGVADGRNASKPSSEKRKSLPRAPRMERTVEVVKETKPLPSPKRELLIEYIGPENTFPPRGRCQYTRDDIAQPPWKMCGHPVQAEGKPWCEEHAAICHQPQQTNKARGKNAA